MLDAFAFMAYGLLLLTDLFLIFFWGRIAYRRIRQMGYSCWGARHDTYILVAAFLTATSVGTGLIFCAGLIAFADPTSHMDILVASGVILVGLFTLAIAKSGFVWTIEHRRESKIWRAFLIVSLIWIVGSLSFCALYRGV